MHFPLARTPDFEVLFAQASQDYPRDSQTSVTLVGVSYGLGASAMAFQLRSPAFGPGGDIPVKHTCDGSDVSPPLRWTDPPDGTKSFALAVNDIDSTSGISVHWLFYGIPAPLRELPEGIPRQDAVPGMEGRGSTISTLSAIPGPALRRARRTATPLRSMLSTRSSPCRP